MFQCDTRPEEIMFELELKSTKTPMLKKRSDEWAHEVKKIITNVDEHIPFAFGDRFIPRRYRSKNNERNAKTLFKPKTDDVLTMSLNQGYWRHENLKLVMNGVFGIKQRRILEFQDFALRESNILQKVATHELIYGNKRDLDWPCTPRNKPLAFPDTTHDLPGFDMYSDLNVIAWSVTGQIAASFGRDLVLWSPAIDLTMVYKIKSSKAIAYCPKGKYLAVGCLKRNWPVFELWNLRYYKEMCIQNGHVFSCQKSEVRCIEWEKSGKVVVCGTELGTIYVFSVPNLHTVHKIKWHTEPVFSMKFSPTSRYLATCDIQGNVFIYHWSSCEIHVRLKSRRKLRAVIAWHPWNGTDLAISEDIPASIVILNVPSKEIVAYYQRKDFNCQIDSITFSKLSGELVVSYSYKNSDGCLVSEIVVMSSLDRIVDVLRINESSVRFMMWSPDGMQLATAGNDETLTFWNFFAFRTREAVQKSLKPRAKIENVVKERTMDSNKKFNLNSFVVGKVFQRLSVLK